MRRYTELGKSICLARKKAGLTGGRLGELTGISQSKISKIENGLLLPSPKDVRSIALALNLTHQATKKLVEQIDEFRIETVSWRLAYSSGFAEKQTEIANLETQTSHMRIFQMNVIPGLLQTKEYMKTLLSLWENVAGEINIEEAINARIARQSILLDQAKLFEFIIMETVLLPAYCTPRVIEAQLDHIIAMQALPNVKIMIKKVAQMRSPPRNGFCIFDDTLVSVETLTAEVQVSGEKDIQTYLRHFDDLRQDVLFHSGAAAFLGNCKETLASTRPIRKAEYRSLDEESLRKKTF
jgi:transcriptional regulator with XRE-family HTH domain